MKRIFTLLAFTAVLSCTTRVVAQSITHAHDTINVNASASGTWFDSLYNTTSSTVTLEWKVISTDFPSDWIAAAGFCDVPDCFPVSSLWPTGVGTTKQSDPYAPGQMEFKFTFDPASVSAGASCHYIRVRLNNKYVTGDTVITTYKVCKVTTRVPVVKTADEVQLYPNPATTELNVVFDASADVKNIAIYNLIGKVVSVYHVSGNSANLNLENEPSGIYFLRLVNSTGQVVATRKFTKQ